MSVRDRTATLAGKGGLEMTTVSHESPVRRWSWLSTPGLWEALAISAMWLAVLFASVFGPDFVSRSNDGNETVIPSGVAVALFAFLASWTVAKHGLRHGER
jgi:hypothetical protein